MARKKKSQTSSPNDKTVVSKFTHDGFEVRINRIDKTGKFTASVYKDGTLVARTTFFDSIVDCIFNIALIWKTVGGSQ